MTGPKTKPEPDDGYIPSDVLDEMDDDEDDGGYNMWNEDDQPWGDGW